MIDEISDRKSSSRKEKPENVDIKSIIKDDVFLCGLGSDNNIYFWYRKHATWYIHNK